MKLLHPAFEVVDYNNVLTTIEKGGRICYKSEDKICEGSDVKLISHLKNMNHASVLEHGVVTVYLRADRAFLAEITRHRLVSFSVVSQRYVNYSKDKFDNQISVIIPPYYQEKHRATEYHIWYNHCKRSEEMYLELIGLGSLPQEARSVLPNSTMTEMQLTANCREWLHIFELRTAKAAHPQMRQLMIPLAFKFNELWPCIYDKYTESNFDKDELQVLGVQNVVVLG
jgi:thymidylate synthase (FAD)